MVKKSLLATLICFLSIAGSAIAMPIIPGDGGACLQAIFDGNGWGLDAIDDQMEMPLGWGLTEGSTGSNMTMYWEGLSGTSFGIYSLAGGERVEVFGAEDTPEARAIVGFDGDVLVVQYYDDDGWLLPPVIEMFDFTGNAFGFFIVAGGNTLFSDPAKNPGGEVAILVYNLEGDSYVFAGEIGGDNNFCDVVAHAESIKPVPEPGTIFLLGSGLIGMAAVGRGVARRKYKST